MAKTHPIGASLIVAVQFWTLIRDQPISVANNSPPLGIAKHYASIGKALTGIMMVISLSTSTPKHQAAITRLVVPTEPTDQRAITQVITDSLNFGASFISLPK